MMLFADQDAVVQVGAAVVLPVLDVVGVAPSGVASAAGCLAVPVACLQGAALAWGHRSVFAADPEHLDGVLAQQVGQPVTPACTRVGIGAAAGAAASAAAVAVVAVVGAAGDEVGDARVAQEPVDRVGSEQDRVLGPGQGQLAADAGARPASTSRNRRTEAYQPSINARNDAEESGTPATTVALAEALSAHASRSRR